jgi:hypothetical protein
MSSFRSHTWVRLASSQGAPPPGERFEELVLLSPLKKRGYCFFLDAEAAADVVAVSFLYSALA